MRITYKKVSFPKYYWILLGKEAKVVETKIVSFFLKKIFPMGLRMN